MIHAAPARVSSSKSSDEIAIQLKTLSTILAGSVALLALVVIAGWLFDIVTLKSVMPDLAPMKANSAVCFLLAGVSLILFGIAPKSRRTYYVRQACASGVVLIGLLTLLEYISGAGLGIDHLLSTTGKEVAGASDPGPMAPNTSFVFILLGISLLLTNARRVHDQRPAQLLALIVFLFAAVAWMGYSTGGQSFEGISALTRITVPSTIGFMLVAIAALCARPSSGFMSTLTSDNAGGVAARRLLPATLGLPLLLVWLKSAGEEAGLFNYDVGTWLLVLASLLVFGLLVWLTVRPLENADKKLKEATAELERSNSELENFAYIASHDLKQPLRKIEGFTKLLSEQYRGKLSSEADEFIGYTVDSAERMRDLIDDLLDYSRIGTDEKPLEPVDSGQICDDAITDLDVAIDKSHAKVRHGEMPLVTFDPAQLEQLFLNLIGNSIKFMGDRSPRVYIDAEPEDGNWVFSVQDNGIGIEPEYRERIFEIFKRLSTRDQHEGSGLGLAICKKIVERHGGRIWLESERGVGSIFYFTIPAVKEQD